MRPRPSPWLWLLATLSWLVACGGSAAPTTPAPAATVATSPAAPTLPAATSSAADVTAPTAAPVRVELTYDVVCPWCRIGHTRLARAIAAFGQPVEVVYRPFLLEPDLPPEGADLRARLGAKYGADRLDAMFARVAQAGAPDGLRFDFGKVTRSPSSVLAHVLVGAAPPAAREALLTAIQDAYFERGEDIGDAAVLTRLWVGVGLPAAAAEAALADPAARDRVRAEADAAARSGIHGVPSFAIGDRVIGGAQPLETLVDALRAAAAGR